MPPSREEISTAWLPLCPKKGESNFYFRFTNGMRGICSNGVNLILPARVLRTKS